VKVRHPKQMVRQFRRVTRSFLPSPLRLNAEQTLMDRALVRRSKGQISLLSPVIGRRP